VIYELHVGGFTRHPSSGVATEKRGTYAGVIERSHTSKIGITAVELLPVAPVRRAGMPAGKTNYGAMRPSRSSRRIRRTAHRRARSQSSTNLGTWSGMAHRAGLEVILTLCSITQRKAAGQD
jgi:glycogen operon protein